MNLDIGKIKNNLSEEKADDRSNYTGRECQPHVNQAKKSTQPEDQTTFVKVCYSNRTLEVWLCFTSSAS